MNLQELIQQTYKQARMLKACPLFTGKEQTIEEMIELFTSPQGMEFCMTNHFPNIATLRAFAKYQDIGQSGIFIDEPHVTLSNVPRIVLVGRTTADIYCDKLQNYNIYLLSGARAVVNCAGWAVVRIEAERGCSVIKNISEHAVIL